MPESWLATLTSTLGVHTEDVTLNMHNKIWYVTNSLERTRNQLRVSWIDAALIGHLADNVVHSLWHH